MNRFTPRIHRSWSDLSGVLISEVKPSVFRFIVAQHEADEQVNRTHVHMLMYNTVIKEEAFKRRINKYFDPPLKGNKEWSWTNTLPEVDRAQFWETGDYGSASELEIFKYVKYILKGDISNLKYKHNVGDQFIANAIASWQQPAAANPQTLTIIEKVKRIPYQQDVITGAAAEWKKYKESPGEIPLDEIPRSVLLNKLKDIICTEMRRVNKGINPYMVKELAYAVLYDDLDYRDIVLEKITL